MTKPTLNTITACDGTTLKVTTRVAETGDLVVEVFDNKKRKVSRSPLSTLPTDAMVKAAVRAHNYAMDEGMNTDDAMSRAIHSALRAVEG